MTTITPHRPTLVPRRDRSSASAGTPSDTAIDLATRWELRARHPALRTSASPVRFPRQRFLVNALEHDVVPFAATLRRLG
jgi:hypothetical protein